MNRLPPTSCLSSRSRFLLNAVGSHTTGGEGSEPAVVSASMTELPLQADYQMD